MTKQFLPKSCPKWNDKVVLAWSSRSTHVGLEPDAPLHLIMRCVDLLGQVNVVAAFDWATMVLHYRQNSFN